MKKDDDRKERRMDRNRLLEDLSLQCDCTRPLEFTGRNVGGYDIYRCPACEKAGRQKRYRLPEDVTNFAEYRNRVDTVYTLINMGRGEKTSWEDEIIRISEDYSYAAVDPQFILLETACYTDNFRDPLDLGSNYNYVNDRYNSLAKIDNKNAFPLNHNGVTMFTACKRWLEKDMARSEYDKFVRDIFNHTRSYESRKESRNNFKADVEKLLKLDTIHNDFTKDDPVYHLTNIIVYTHNFRRRLPTNDRDYLAVQSEYEMIKKNLLGKVDADDERVLSECKDWLETNAKFQKAIVITGLVFFAAVLIVFAVFTFAPRKLSTEENVGGISVEIDNKAFPVFSKWNIGLYAEKIEESSPEHETARVLLSGVSDKFEVYDISFLSGEKVVQPRGNVEVTMHIPEGFYAKNVAIYHIDTNGKCEVVKSTVMEAYDTVVFETDHFSLYAIVDRPNHISFSDTFGHEIPEQTIRWGGTVEEPQEINQEGYDFLGWYFGEEKWDFANGTVSKDMTLVAKWAAHTYTVTYDDNIPLKSSGNIVGMPDDAVCKYDGDLTLGSAPTLVGWIFGGWYKDEDCTERAGSAGDILSNANLATEGTVTLYAKWTADTYTVTYDANRPEMASGEVNGILTTPLTLCYDDNYTLANIPTLTGWTFMGWYKDAACTAKVGNAGESLTKPNLAIGENVTIYAGWKVNRYTVTFDAQGGECDVGSKSVTYDSPFGELPIASKSNHTFVGWFTSVNGNNRVESNLMFTFDGNITLYAHYNEHIYKANFETFGGSEIASFNFGYGETVERPVDPIKQGYTFGGWYKNSECTETFDFDAKNYQSVAIYAKWIANAYNVMYDSNKPARASGDVSGISTVPNVWTYDSDAHLAIAPNLAGWIFTGWYKDAACTVKVGNADEILTKPNFVTSGSVTLYAGWTSNKYSVSYDANGGEGSTSPSSHVYDIQSPLSKNSYTKEGYSFKSWNTKADGTGTEYSNGETVCNLTSEKDTVITLYAQWKNNSYTVNYDPNGGEGSVEATTHMYDIESGLRANNFTKAGYIFDCWNTRLDGSGASYSDEEAVRNLVSDKDGEITLYAQWENNMYLVIYDSNCGEGTNISTHFYDVERALKSSSFFNEGYTFKCWNTKPDGSGISYSGSQVVKNLTLVPDGCVILYAQWTQNSYTVQYNANGGEGTMGATSHAYGVPKALSKNVFTRENYDFVGWNTEPDGSGTDYFDGETVENLTMVADGVVTLYAQWRIYTIITYDENDTIYGDVSVRGGVYRTFNTTTKLNVGAVSTYSEYYRFDGWFTSSTDGLRITNGDGALIPDVSGYTDSDGKWIFDEASITLYANWSKTMSGTYIADADGVSSIGETGEYVIICDVNMDNTLWTPISKFSGTIDGQSHSIYNFHISSTGTCESGNFGFIIDNSGTIKNLNIGKYNVTTYDKEYSVKYYLSYDESADKESALRVGGIAVYNSGIISSCRLINVRIEANMADVNNNHDLSLLLGGIVAKNTGKISDCRSISSSLNAYAAAKKNSGDNNNGWLGGICAINSNEVYYCGISNTTLNICMEGDGAFFNRACPTVHLGGIVAEQTAGSTLRCWYSSGNTMNINTSQSADTTEYSGLICGKETGGEVED